ncbi:MAG TPA: PKD domain-containing protein, partial [Humisphaera sp.]|nr:PKD domain-containing protein [Humisphaera sp.]
MLEQRWHLTVTLATITPPTDSAVAGAPLTFSFAGYSDDNTAITFGVLWGDGSGETLNGNPATETHPFADPGVYTIAATATDDGASYTTTLPLTVSPPSFTVTPPTK